MKNCYTVLAILFIGLASCTKESMRGDCNEAEKSAKDAVAIHTGAFQFVAKSGTGKATIYRKEGGALMLGLEGMSLSSSAHFKIMAATAKEDAAVKIFSVAGLSGSVFYDLPAQFDLSLYQYILIQTEPSEEVVATAELN